jgi:hypothetical protein
LQAWTDGCRASAAKILALPCAPPVTEADPCGKPPPDVDRYTPDSIRALFVCVDAAVACGPDGAPPAAPVDCQSTLVRIDPPPPIRPPPPPASAGGGGANRTACAAYVEAFNVAPCSGVDLRVDELCPPTLDLSPCDLSAFYGCMAAAVKCNGAFLDVSGQVSCPAPTCR